MKKQLLKFLLGIVYIGIVVVLLFLHIQQIAGQPQRIMAMVETILLVIPSILFLFLYMRLQQLLLDKQPDEKEQLCENKQPMTKKIMEKILFGYNRIKLTAIDILFIIYV